MLTLCDGRSRFPRREFLRIGGLALGGLTLPQLLASRASAAAGGRTVRDKSVIFLFLHGGPSQFETFDPKMEAPVDIRSATGETPTTLPGITFGSSFERVAKLADRIAIVRSFRTGDANHDIKPIVGRDTLNANMGSLYARVAGTSNPINGIPRNIALVPRAVDPDTGPAIASFGRFDSSGTLGGAYAPFVPGSGGDLQGDMQLQLARTRIDDRRALLSELDRIKRYVDATALEGLDRLQQQAFETILGGVAEAFDLSKEDPKTIARYDTAPLARPEAISRKWNNYPHYVDNAKTLGKLLLLARRLCEAGCGFITVTTSFVWDMHADENNATVEEGMQYMGLPLDWALSAFLEDVHQRGLSDRILLVVTGEMGRTPRINQKGGRDHWGGLTPLLLAGGGLPMGQVIGHSAADGGQPASEPITNAHLVSTILHSLLDVGAVRLLRDMPTDLLNLLSASPAIPGLM